MTVGQVEIANMHRRMRASVAPEFEVRKKNAHEAAQHSMRLLVRAGNQDRGLMEDLDWQSAMTHLNEIIRKGAV